MSKFYMMIGLPGVGKSTYAKETLMKEDPNAVLISSDSLREVVLNDVNKQTDNKLIFKMMFNMTVVALKNGKNVIYDATNVIESRRRELVESIKREVTNLETIGIYCIGELNMAFLGNAARDRRVPHEVITRIHKQLDVPTIQRDSYFDSIEYKDCSKNGIQIRKPFGLETLLDAADYDNFVGIMDACISNFSANIDLPQDCPYHTLSVSRHIYEAFNYARKNLPTELESYKEDILYALAFHDIGKSICKNFRRGSRYANFIGHEKVSAQIFMKQSKTYSCLGKNVLFAMALIKEHSFSYKDKDPERYEEELSNIEKMYGQPFRKCLEFVRESDMSAK